jgi:hypothetical protein
VNTVPSCAPSIHISTLYLMHQQHQARQEKKPGTSSVTHIEKNLRGKLPGLYVHEWCPNGQDQWRLYLRDTEHVSTNAPHEQAKVCVSNAMTLRRLC